MLWFLLKEREKMKNLKIKITAILLLIAFVASAQQVIFITGKVTDEKTGEPLPFVNIGLVGTYIGVATNLDGFYELRIPNKHKDKIMEISAVGYSTVKESVANIAKRKKFDVVLAPMAFDIGEVEVKAVSRLQHTRVKKAIKAIAQNYLQQPFNYEMYYRGELKSKDGVERLREAAVRLYDNRGYQRGNAFQVFKERGYEFVEVRKNFENETLADGSTYLDELLELDIVRVRGNVLNLNAIDDYKLHLEGETEYEGDKVWIIAYTNPKPTLATTGDYYAKTYKGKLYIKQKDYAIVKNVLTATARNYSPQGRSFFVSKDRQHFLPLELEYTAITTYKKYGKVYYLSSISYQRTHRWVSKLTAEKKFEKINAELLVNSVNTANPKLIERRAYYENKPYNATFWESYNIIKDR